MLQGWHLFMGSPCWNLPGSLNKIRSLTNSSIWYLSLWTPLKKINPLPFRRGNRRGKNADWFLGLDSFLQHSVGEFRLWLLTVLASWIDSLLFFCIFIKLLPKGKVYVIYSKAYIWQSLSLLWQSSPLIAKTDHSEHISESDPTAYSETFSTDG